MPTKHLISLYYTLIHPYLNYGTLIWGSANKSQLNKLKVLQNKSVRAITNSTYNESAGPLYKQTNIMAFDDLYKSQLIQFMYAHKHKQLPLPLMKLYSTNRETHQHFTRHHQDPHIISRILCNDIWVVKIM